MSNVEFEADKIGYSNRQNASSGYGGSSNTGTSGNQPKMAKWLISKGIVKSAGAAQGLLIALIVINLIITYIVIDYFL